MEPEICPPEVRRVEVFLLAVKMFDMDTVLLSIKLHLHEKFRVVPVVIIINEFLYSNLQEFVIFMYQYWYM